MTELPIAEFGFELSKQQSWDSVRLGQQVFFLPFRVFDHNACRYRNKSLQQCHVMNEQEKKRAYSEKKLLVHFYTYGVFNQG